MAKTLVAAVLAVGLLASGDACAWMCGGAQDGGDSHAAAASDASHCGGDSAPTPAQGEAPSHDDCRGCALDTAASSMAFDGPGGYAPLLAASVLATSFEGLQRPAFQARIASLRVDRAPPRDVLALTTTLLL